MLIRTSKQFSCSSYSFSLVFVLSLRVGNIFIDIIKHTLKKGIKVNISQLTGFLKFMLMVSPFCPDGGTSDAETLDTVGTDIKNWYTEMWIKDIPPPAFFCLERA